MKIGEVPARGEMVRLHALQAVNEDGLTLEINRSILCDNCALTGIPGPEGVAHGAPGRGGVGAEIGGAIGANLEAWGDTGDSDVDDRLLVGEGLDGIGGAIVRQFDGAVVGIEVELVLAYVETRQLVRGPQDGLVLGLGVEDLGVPLAGGPDAASQSYVSLGGFCILVCGPCAPNANIAGERPYATLL